MRQLVRQLLEKESSLRPSANDILFQRLPLMLERFDDIDDRLDNEIVPSGQNQTTR